MLIPPLRDPETELSKSLIQKHCPGLAQALPERFASLQPWELCSQLADLIIEMMNTEKDMNEVSPGVFVHSGARVHESAIIHGPVMLGPGVVIGSHAVLRDGAYLRRESVIGSGVELKQSVVGANSAVAHLNYVGNSVLGNSVNIEAGAILANHFNERLKQDREIAVVDEDHVVQTGVTKFGAVVGDNCRIGANAVTSPGTVLLSGTVVGRLELVRQTD